MVEGTTDYQDSLFAEEIARVKRFTQIHSEEV